MINDEIEVQETDLDTTVEATEEDTTTEVDDKNTVEYWKAEALKNKAILDRNKEKKTETKKESKADGLGYGELAFLTAKGVSDDREVEFVEAELKKSGMELKDLMKNEYFTSKLDNFRELNKTSDATPKGKRSGGVATDSVEYWMAKPIEEVPKDMRTKVVNAKLEKERNKGVFYNS